ncbi:hypothetical protein RM780_21815 [Streptomyces sp. DSM 44917]|uniref:Uncharacterized protein n=1 Tax=Streptomyces boetiae TaxID=3075541 RepID=A0ABU2LDB6_9ACTN|nr:hypothetical protein [Streptomyces sp. DSM 44917]MDT0309574.1 hypothetical protein [Streptomyces sp. DSM 44917]
MSESTHVTSVHLDERARSVTVTTRHAGLPPDAPAEWREEGFNSWEEAVVYTSVDTLTIDGWHHATPATHTTTPLPGPRLAITLTGPATSVRFHADPAPRRERRGLRSGAF